MEDQILGEALKTPSGLEGAIQVRRKKSSTASKQVQA